MKKPYSYGYLNDKNVTQIMDEFYRLQNLNVIEYDKSINEYPDFVSKLNGFYKEDISDLVDKFLPPSSPSITSPTFCNKHSSNWDMFGINLKTNDCTANNNTNGYMPNIPENFPGSKINPRSYNGKFSDQLQNINYNTNGYNISTRSY